MTAQVICKFCGFCDGLIGGALQPGLLVMM